MGQLYGMDLGDFEAAPNFSASRDQKGKWTASQGFTMPESSWVQAGIKDQFSKGTLITTLFPALNSYWNFLELESLDVSRQPGLLLDINAYFTGFNDAEYESDREVTYSLSGTLAERPIIQHPLFLRECLPGDPAAGDYRAMIIEGYEGVRHVEPRQRNLLTNARAPTINRVTNKDYVDIQGLKPVSWWRLIVEEGVRTWKVPTYRWTVETTQAGGLTPSELSGLGKLFANEDIPGTPPDPIDGGPYKWIKISANDNRSRSAVSTSQTWELGQPGSFAELPGRGEYDSPVEGTAKAGVYEYDYNLLLE